MKFTGKEILDSKEIQELLINSSSKVLEIIWEDGSIRDGHGREIYIENIEVFGKKVISVGEGLWSEPITESMIITVQDMDNELYSVYTTTEASILWGKGESTVRKAIQNGKFELGVDYRKSGRITLITKKAMKKVFGIPKR